MTSNFDFVNSHFPELYKSASKAERMVYADPRASCFYARFTLETAVIWLYDNDPYLQLPYHKNLSALIHEPTFKNNLKAGLFEKIRLIQKTGNLAAHEFRPIAAKDALNLVKELFHFLYWLCSYYSRKGKKLQDIKFNSAIVPHPEKRQEIGIEKLQQLEKQLSQTGEEMRRIVEEREKQTQQQLQTLKAQIKALKEQNEAVFDRHNYNENEANTRPNYTNVLLKGYLTRSDEMRDIIKKLISYKILWLDTEVAYWNTSNPKLSLIQILADPEDKTGESVYIFDVLNLPNLVDDFINEIMMNPAIEKVFHNAIFDLKYLGGNNAQNVTCTYKISKKISKDVLGTSNLKLKTLATELCGFTDIDTEEQARDWGKRSLTAKQLNYAKMDVVYLAAFHQFLLRKKEAINPTLNVTDIKVAFECPRLFYLNKKFGGKTLFIPNNSPKGVGRIFHRLAEDFIIFAKQEPQFQSIFISSENLEVEKVASEMQLLFYSKVFFPKYLEAAITKNEQKADLLNQVWQGITQLIRKWAELLINNSKCCDDRDKLITKTFVAEEKKLEYELNLPNKTQQKISGKFDSLTYNFERQRFCVVDLKTYNPLDKSAQLAQVALYSYMLYNYIIKQRKKVAVDAAIYCVLPEFKEYRYSWEELEDTVYKLIPYKLQQIHKWLKWKSPQPDPPPATNNSNLCDICPQQEKCQSYFPIKEGFKISNSQVAERKANLGASQGQPKIKIRSPKKSELDLDKLGNNLIAILQSYNINADYLGSIAAPAFIRVKIKPQLGITVAKIVKLAEDLKVQLNLLNAPLIATQPGYVSVDLPRQDRQIAYYDRYIQKQKNTPNESVKIAIGVDLNGELIEAELSDANTCHFLVGGTTGSGKSEFLRSILLSLIDRHNPEHLQVILVDPKRVTFSEFENMPWLLLPIVKDSEMAIELMGELVTEMERRYKLLENAKCSDLKDYNRTNQIEPHIVCIFDEYADFMVEKEVKKQLEESIKRLGAKARAAGIHLIVATQRPDATVVTPLIRSNLPARIALKTASINDSKIILGGTETGAANLLGKGDLLYQNGSNLQRLQSLFAKEIQIS